MSAERVALLRRAYQAFNRRDFEAVLALLEPEVEWPNLIEGTTLRGRDQVRAYWQRQLETIDPHVEPLGFAERGDEVAVEVHQVVRARDGGALSDARVWHVYAFAGGRVRAMRVEAGRGWRVWRQDDAGNRHLLRDGLSEGEATALAAQYEARGHKQTYWAEPPEDAGWPGR